jgi:hypothetical protein
VYREPVRVDYVTEAPDVSGDDALFDLFLAVFTSLFKSKSRLEVSPSSFVAVNSLHALDME